MADQAVRDEANKPESHLRANIPDGEMKMDQLKYFTSEFYQKSCLLL
ncbi:hypothetical protein [Paenibacillus sp. FSL K6-2524]